MRMRLDLIDDLLQQHLSLTDTAPVKSDMMREFEVVLTQMPYVGGAESRMSDFFMRLLGFMAIGRVLQRRGVPKDVIAELELESFKRQMLTVSEVERLEAGRKFMSDDSKALIREQAARSHEQKYQGDFVYDYVEPGPNDAFLRVWCQLPRLRVLQNRGQAWGSGSPSPYLQPRFRGV